LDILQFTGLLASYRIIAPLLQVEGTLC